jgi:hypothetical protein
MRFQLGRLMMTPGAMDALRESGESPMDFVDRHANGDWGEVDTEDAEANEDALRTGARLFSVYRTKRGVKLYVLTEAGGDAGTRSHTTLLKPEEY